MVAVDSVSALEPRRSDCNAIRSPRNRLCRVVMVVIAMMTEMVMLGGR